MHEYNAKSPKQGSKRFWRTIGVGSHFCTGLGSNWGYTGQKQNTYQLPLSGSLLLTSEVCRHLHRAPPKHRGCWAWCSERAAHEWDAYDECGGGGLYTVEERLLRLRHCMWFVNITTGSPLWSTVGVCSNFCTGLGSNRGHTGQKQSTWPLPRSGGLEAYIWQVWCAGTSTIS